MAIKITITNAGDEWYRVNGSTYWRYWRYWNELTFGISGNYPLGE